MCSAERQYDLQFWKEELEREINELEKSAADLEVLHIVADSDLRHNVTCVTIHVAISRSELCDRD